MIEHTLKYGDFDDIIELFKRIDKDKIKEVWSKTTAPDKRFLKVNLMIARIFFDMDVEKNYFEGLSNTREVLSKLTNMGNRIWITND